MRLFRSHAPAKALAHDDVVQVDGRPVRLRVDGRATRVSLRLDVAGRQVIATAPTPRKLADAVAFARSRSGWIGARLDALPQGFAFAPGQRLEIQGQGCVLERAAMRIRPRFVPATADEPIRLIASGEGETYAAAVQRALMAEALRRLTERTAVHAAALNQPMPRVGVGDAKARWGSCTPAQRGRPAGIRYSWRLILATPTVLDYVAAHECAHLLEANHGPRFWALVADLCGDHRPARAWLKAHGARLHAVGR
jgi:predicted metal-dependent hydrolase